MAQCQSNENKIRSDAHYHGCTVCYLFDKDVFWKNVTLIYINTIVPNYVDKALEFEMHRKQNHLA